MEFIKSEQTDPGALTSIHFDIFIVAAGYEKRCTYLLEHFSISAGRKDRHCFQGEIE